MHSFFRELSRERDVRIFGPPEYWQHIEPGAYGGMLPFDGDSVIETYRRSGVGLAIFSARHLAEEVVSNRIFEISSAGALCIVHRMGWIERAFGDSFLYIDQNSQPRSLVAQIRAHLDWVRAHPQGAAAKAAAANAIFRRDFSMEVLLGKVLDQHRAWTGRGTAVRSGPTVAVRVEVDTPEEALRTVDSLARQSWPNLGLVLSDGHGVAPRTVTLRHPGRFRWVTAAGPGLDWLKDVKADFLVVADGRCDLFREHIESLLAAHQRAVSGAPPVFAYSGEVRAFAEPFQLHDDIVETRRANLIPMPEDSGALLSWLDGFAPARLLIPLAVLRPAAEAVEALGGLSSGEALVIELLLRAQPAFSFRASVLTRQAGSPAEQAAEAERRRARMRRLVWRLAGATLPPRPHLIGPARLSGFVPDLYPKEMDVIRSAAGIEYLIPATFDVGFDYRDGGLVLPMTLDLERAMLSGERVGEGDLPIVLRVPNTPWAYAADIPLSLPPVRENLAIRIAAEIGEGQVGFGLLYGNGSNFAYRTFAAADSVPAVIHIPVIGQHAESRLVISNDGAGRPATLTITAITLIGPAETVGALLHRWALEADREPMLVPVGHAPGIDYLARPPSAGMAVDVIEPPQFLGRPLPLAIEIPVMPWSYAATIRLTPPAPPSPKALLCIDATISGLADIAVLDRNDADIFCSRILRGNGRRVRVYLPWHLGAPSILLLIRNGGTEQAGFVLLEGIRLADAESPATGTSTGEAPAAGADAFGIGMPPSPDPGAGETWVDGGSGEGSTGEGPAGPPGGDAPIQPDWQRMPRTHRLRVTDMQTAEAGSAKAPLVVLRGGADPAQAWLSAKGARLGQGTPYPILLRPAPHLHAVALRLPLALTAIGRVALHLRLWVAVGAIEVAFFDTRRGRMTVSAAVGASADTHLVCVTVPEGANDLVLRNGAAGASESLLEDIRVLGDPALATHDIAHVPDLAAGPPPPVLVDWRNASQTVPHTADGMLTGPFEILTPTISWAYAFQVPLVRASDWPCVLLQIEAEVRKGIAGFGVAHRSGERFLFRTHRQALPDRQILSLPLRTVDMGNLVIQNSYQPGATEVTVHAVRVVPAWDVLEHLNLPDGDITERGMRYDRALHGRSIILDQQIALPHGPYTLLVSFSEIQTHRQNAASLAVEVLHSQRGPLLWRDLAGRSGWAEPFRFDLHHDAGESTPDAPTPTLRIRLTHLGNADILLHDCLLVAGKPGVVTPPFPTGEISVLNRLAMNDCSLQTQKGIRVNASDRPGGILHGPLPTLPEGRYRFRVKGRMYGRAAPGSGLVVRILRDQHEAPLAATPVTPVEKLNTGRLSIDFDVPDDSGPLCVEILHLGGVALHIHDVVLDILGRAAWVLDHEDTR
ncbi:hypothetical protein HL658_35640 [Azospirillum sp. RWY-5-1]|uniref:Spore protein YkvP/CgeB glycosyl transferase-like domain-containing protein n=1 Tax=Azospirillum oleiclasticum TaxID=2735135 RepID=A0ABX2TME4_9PROT|nr:hypothetical protein [Azospirillum oleiclasticum]NYZ17905.1 hypothetical protein [Azospirillum oleiclasticum]NYZ25120.1 hypothetical protein [Azospirillum oleiclasticum]